MESHEVVVLAGGISHEREVSLRSGRRVVDALHEAGHTVSLIDPDAQLFAALARHQSAVVWPVVHGSSGEDGALLDLLKAAGRNYVGPSPQSARLAWHKPTTKTLIERAGFATPASITVALETFRELGAASVLEVVSNRLGAHVVVKPAKGGSAQGVSLVSDSEALPRAMVEAFTYCDEAIIEHRLTGIEVGVTVADTGDGVMSLPAVEIVPLDGPYSFEARYNAGETTFYAPARLTSKAERSVAEAAVGVATALGLTSLCRIDMIVDDAGTPWILEANAIPGLTETSLAPLAFEAAGIPLADALNRILMTTIAGASRQPPNGASPSSERIRFSQQRMRIPR